MANRVQDARSLSDPWGRPFVYRLADSADGFEILSLGRDGKPGGTGEDADIIEGN
jgi:general secretion pathway protein G